MACEPPPSSGVGSATAGLVVRASWGEDVVQCLNDHDERIGDLEIASAAVWRGPWAEDTAYNAGDLVSHNGSVWRASEAIPVASPDDEPGVTSPSAWELFVEGAGIITRTVTLTVDGSGSDITTGIKGYARVPYGGTIVRWTLLSTDDNASPAAGDIEFDVYKDTFASYPPTTSIVASAPPQLTNDQAAEDTTLSGWTTSVTAGDVFGFEVVSVSGVTRATLHIDIEAAA